VSGLPGRRLSAIEGDSGFLPALILRGQGLTPRVFLNGSEIEECVTVDQDAGEVLVFARDEWGEPIIDDDEEWILVAMRGLVSVDLVPTQSAAYWIATAPWGDRR
jgi:hypothetical protein